MARDPSKTEQATPKRINKARGEGNVAKSQELTKTISVLGGLIILAFWMQFIAKDLMGIFRFFMINGPTYQMNEVTVVYMGRWLGTELAKMLLPVFLFNFVCVFLILRWQVGKLWTFKPMKPKLSKFNPLKGLKRMFVSVQTFIRLGKSLAIAICIGAAPYFVIKDELPNFISLYYEDAMGVAIYILSLAAKIVIYALWPMIIIAIADFFYTKWDYNQNLKMTKDEVKDERKQAEGDPKVKMKQRQEMMKMSMNRMMQEIPKADVVITNPTHIAVALRYDPMIAPAPMVVAVGADFLAKKIKDIARENGVPIRENVPLARALYKQTKVGDTIPAELFQAVAAILAQIWKTKPPKHVKLQ